MKFKETIYHTFYKDGKYTEEPSNVFLFLENGEDYIKIDEREFLIYDV